MSENRFTASNGVQVWIQWGQLRSTTTGSERSTFLAEGKRLQALREFFQNEPKPWHNAEPGEIWGLTIDGNEYGCSVDPDLDIRDPRPAKGGFISIEDPMITAGRRIWPEGD